MKQGRVVILLAGRHAGKKAIIVKQYDDGKKVLPIVLIGLGQEIPTRPGCWYWEIPIESYQENERKENWKKNQGQAIR